MVCAKYLGSKQKYDDQCFSKSIGGTERETYILWRERGRPCEEMWVSQENPKSSTENSCVFKAKENFKSKGQYCADIHIPDELHSSNLFSEP
jgi:hypothetical protein